MLLVVFSVFCVLSYEYASTVLAADHHLRRAAASPMGHGPSPASSSLSACQAYAGTLMNVTFNVRRSRASSTPPPPP